MTDDNPPSGETGDRAVTWVDVAVVGAGPAGLAAAVTCARAGLTVCLIDRGTAVGGQYWRQPAAPLVGKGRLGSRQGRRPVGHHLATCEALQDRLAEGIRSGVVDLRLRTQVWTAVGPATSRDADLAATANPSVVDPATIDPATVIDLHVVGTGTGPGVGPAGVAGVVRASRVVLATGAHDIGLPFPGWDLPGVMTVGGIQALLTGSDVVPGHRVALGGTGPFLLPVAAALAVRGVDVVGVFEANAPTTWLPHLATVTRHPAQLAEGLTYAATLARHRVPFRPRTMIVEAHGRDRVEAVSVRRLDRAGAPRPGAVVRHRVDAVGVGWGFSPILDLAVTLGCATRPGDNGFAVIAVDAQQRSSVPGVLVAGEPTGVGGATLALAEGELAGHVVVGDLSDSGVRAGHTGLRRRTVRREVVRLRTFATAMHDTYPVPLGWAAALRPDTLICRCEEVDAATVLAAIASGADTVRQVKQLTRAGMGWCQGRTCEPACALLVAGADHAASDNTRPVAGRSEPASFAGATERLVAQPISLGALADLLPRSSPQPDRPQ